MAVVKRFTCLEAGCDTVIVAHTDEELIQAVQAHVAEAHDSFELEEFILAGAREVEEGAPAVKEGPKSPPLR